MKILWQSAVKRKKLTICALTQRNQDSRGTFQVCAVWYPPIEATTRRHSTPPFVATIRRDSRPIEATTIPLGRGVRLDPRGGWGCHAVAGLYFLSFHELPPFHTSLSKLWPTNLSTVVQILQTHLQSHRLWTPGSTQNPLICRI